MGCLSSKPSLDDSVVQLPEWHPNSIENSAVVSKFNELNKNIFDFAEDVFPSSPPDSSGLAETALFQFLTSLNEHLYNRIFTPFHPCLPPEESNKRNELYEGEFGKESSLHVAGRKARAFEEVESRIASSKPGFIDGLVTSISQDYDRIQSSRKFHSELHTIVEEAYEWNVTVRGTRVGLLCRPFSPPVPSTFDPTTSKAFYKHPSDPDRTQVAAVVVMGLEVADLGGRVRVPVYKVDNAARAQVLLGN